MSRECHRGGSFDAEIPLADEVAAFALAFGSGVIAPLVVNFPSLQRASQEATIPVLVFGDSDLGKVHGNSSCVDIHRSQMDP